MFCIAHENGGAGGQSRCVAVDMAVAGPSGSQGEILSWKEGLGCGGSCLEHCGVLVSPWRLGLQAPRVAPL
jgi:hypothetical protein